MLHNAMILKAQLKQNMAQFEYCNLNFINKKDIHRYTYIYMVTYVYKI